MADSPGSVFRVCPLARGLLEKFNVWSQVVLERVPPGGPKALERRLLSTDTSLLALLCHHLSSRWSSGCYSWIHMQPVALGHPTPVLLRPGAAGSWPEPGLDALSPREPGEGASGSPGNPAWASWCLGRVCWCTGPRRAAGGCLLGHLRSGPPCSGQSLVAT